MRGGRSAVPPPCLPQVLQDMVPPKKHLLRHQPANAQIGLMEGNTFCTTLQPRLFTMDLNVVEHKVFYTEVGARPGWGRPRVSGSLSVTKTGQAASSGGGGSGRREPAVAWLSPLRRCVTSEMGEAGMCLRCPGRWGLLSPWSAVCLCRELAL